MAKKEVESEKDFDFSVLWNDEQEEGGFFAKILPILNTILLVIITALIFMTK